MNKYKYSVGGAYKDANDYLYKLQSLIQKDSVLNNTINNNLINNIELNELELDLESFINTRSNFETTNFLIQYKSSFDNYKTVDSFDFNTELLKSYTGKLSYKEGVNSNGLEQDILNGVNVFRKYGDVTITSGLRLVIKKGAGMKSLHPYGKAVDIRLNDFLRANLDNIKKELLDYDVLDEGDHIHLEYQLKKKKAQYGYNDNLLLKNNLFNNKTNNESNINLDNSSYGLLDLAVLGLGQTAQLATQAITSGFKGAESFIRTGDGLGAVTDMFGDVLVVGGILKGVKGVRDSVRQKRQDAVASRLQDFGAIGSLQQMFGNQKEEEYERKQRIASFKRLVFTNFNNNGINNNLMYYKYGGKYKFLDGGKVLNKLDAKDANGNTYTKISGQYYKNNVNNKEYYYNDINRKFILYERQEAEKLTNYFEDDYIADRVLVLLAHLSKKYGSLKVRDNFSFDGISNAFGDVITANRAHFNNANNTISLLNDRKDISTYLSELAQHQNKKNDNNFPRIIKELITTGFYLYNTEGTFEHEAHRIIELKLIEEFDNLIGYKLELQNYQNYYGTTDLDNINKYKVNYLASQYKVDDFLKKRNIKNVGDFTNLLEKDLKEYMALSDETERLRRQTLIFKDKKKKKNI